MIRDPKITVYIPNFNYGRFIRLAVESVLRQTMEDWELIIIDDGSTDDSLTILAAYRDHPKIRIVEQENKGLNVSNNIALRLARGEYIVRLDADDYMDENMLLVLGHVLDTNPEIGVVYPDYFLIDEEGRVGNVFRRKKIGNEVDLLDLPAHGACTMFRKKNLQELGGYSEDYTCQDGYEIWLRMIQRYRAYNVNVPLFYYRQHPVSLTKNEAKIGATRREINRRFVDTQKQGRRPRVLGLIPVISRSIYPQAAPFTEIAGKPLLMYSLEEASRAAHLDRIVLAADDEQILARTASFPKIAPLLRPPELSRSTARMEDIARFVLDTLAHCDGYLPEAVCFLYANAPLRKAAHIDHAVDVLSTFDVDSVISVEEELAYCYHHEKQGLSCISTARRNLRLEREVIYKENGAIYLSRTSVIDSGRLVGDKIGHILMLPWEGIRITDQYRLWLTERIIKEWPSQNP